MYGLPFKTKNKYGLIPLHNLANKSTNEILCVALLDTCFSWFVETCLNDFPSMVLLDNMFTTSSLWLLERCRFCTGTGNITAELGGGEKEVSKCINCDGVGSLTCTTCQGSGIQPRYLDRRYEVPHNVAALSPCTRNQEFPEK